MLTELILVLMMLGTMCGGLAYVVLGVYSIDSEIMAEQAAERARRD